MADAAGREREKDLVPGSVLADPADDLDRGSGGGRRTGDVGTQPGRNDPLPDRPGSRTPDDDDHRVSLAVLRAVTESRLLKGQSQGSR